MTRLLIILLLVLPLGVAAQTIEAPAKFDGKVTIDVPKDDRIEALEKRVAKLEARLESLAKKRVTVAEITESTLEALP